MHKTSNAGLAKKHVKNLSTVQSLALRMTCNLLRGTPLKGIEVIFDIPPIDQFIKAEAAKAQYRIIGTNKESRSPNGHLSKGAKDLEDLELLGTPSDHIGKERIWEKGYHTEVSRAGPDILQGVRCYTDGSKTKFGTGSGICLMNDDKVVAARAFGLSKTTTVFQAELHAIRMAATVIPQKIGIGTNIHIMCDSQAAIKALEEVDTSSQLAKKQSLH